MHSRHQRRLRQLGVLIACLLITSAAQAASSGLLADGGKWQTAYYVVDSGRAGPTVMLVGGVHGDEPAGARAAEQIRSWPITRGRLIVVPQANRPGLAAPTRYLPGEPKERRDLNRNFPRTDEKDNADGELANALWRFVKKQQPDWLIDLHEGFDFHRSNGKSVGSSVIHFSSPQMDKLVDAMLAKVNATIPDPDRKLVALRKTGPVNGSLARAAHERLKCHALILETTSARQRLPVRAREHRLMVHHLLLHLQMVDVSAHHLVPKRAGAGPAKLISSSAL